MKVCIVDDHPSMVSGVQNIVSSIPQSEILWTANSIKETVSKLNGSDIPEIIIMDISFPDGDGFYLAEIVKQKYPEIKILFLSMHNQFDFVIKAVKSQANGYLTKDCSDKEILAAVDAVYNDNIYYSQKILQLINQVIAQSTLSTFIPEASPYNLLSDREKEVFEKLSHQLSIKEIAYDLKISNKTVFAHRQNIYKKLAIHDQQDLDEIAVEIGIL
ncbi:MULTISPECIES: response regulator transcription factor [unclassified Oceanispirochaeta]|uniref:response regulator transcription factor n=1 Tax=unclassified Oceanispirochaeta TaxID=2635722 RepID=UPI000E09A153|nr:MULTISPECIES: response regulator transcription factor [unclassified Oceanispirochaeta]MBF9019015.1 response regulator transcription factor [Oceanispirochaeta sp. M2]NPD75513.1 response regulator transcription factor [Oceanispirochaeta sp. M1]RDG28634.1 DNA-binding response regulator [Oceanispirochaeta sp. M1]